MNKKIELIHRFYDVSFSVDEKKSLINNRKKIVSVGITFTPKKYFELSPEIAHSKAIYHVFQSGKIELYDMIYIRPHEMPLLRGFGTNYDLDEYLEIKSYELMYEKISQ
jgi:hypothetical protein